MPDKLSMSQDFIQKLHAILDLNLENEKFGVSELATEIGLSRSQLHRKLQDINGKSSSQFIREYRLEKAMEMLKSKQATVSEIAYRVGFSSPSYFSRCFHSFYGFSPGEVKFQRSIAPPKKTYSKKLVAFIPIIILVGLIVFNKAFNKKDDVAEASIEKTIAVLPFVNDSNNEDNMYFCNGIMGGIRDHLAKIPEFYVISRLSVEPYRNTSTPLKVIAKELDVNYVIEGRVQRIGNRAIILAELIQVNNNKVLWSERYDEDVSEIFAVQTKVIESITNNLEIIILPNLNDELNTKPTQDNVAYEYYLKGEEYRFRAYQELQKTKDWLDLLDKAKLSYELAIERDSLFANAYLGLALNLYKKNEPYVLNGNNIDDVLLLISKALQLKPNMEQAYLLRGDYYKLFKRNDNARDAFNKVLDLNPNNVYALNALIDLYRIDNQFDKLGATLKKLEEAAKTKEGLFLLNNNYALIYHLIEQYDLSDYYFKKASDLGPDNYYNRSLLWSYITSNRIDEAIDYIKNNSNQDNQDRNAHLASLYLRIGDFKQALEYSEKSYKQIEDEGINSHASLHLYAIYGYTLVQSGQIEKGNEMVKKQISVFNKILQDRQIHTTSIIRFNFIHVYYYLKDYEKSYEYMKKFETANGWNYKGLLTLAKQGIHFEPLRGDDHFQQFVERGEKQVDNIRDQITPYLPSQKSYKTD